jgi:hypothetical protein
VSYFQAKRKDIAEMTDGELAIFWDYAKQEYEKGYSAFRVRFVGSSNDGMRPHIDFPDEFNREVKALAKQYMKQTLDMLQDEMEERNMGAYKL